VVALICDGVNLAFLEGEDVTPTL